MAAPENRPRFTFRHFIFLKYRIGFLVSREKIQGFSSLDLLLICNGRLSSFRFSTNVFRTLTELGVEFEPCIRAVATLLWDYLVKAHNLLGS